MWTALLRGVVKAAVKALPWERIAAILISLVLRAIQKREPEKMAKAKRFIGKTAHQLAVLAAVVEDDTLTADEAKALLRAWSRGEDTPEGIEAKVLGEKDDEE